jgi:hypothetical protein
MGTINEKFVSPRKRLGMGGTMPDGDYGVESLASKAVNGPAGEEGDSYMPDHKRGAAPPIQGNQANPDHGPSHYNHKNWSKA